MCEHDHSAVGLGLAGASLPWSLDKMITSQAAKGHDNVLRVRCYKPISLSEDLSWLFPVDTLRDKFSLASIALFLSLPEKPVESAERGSCLPTPVFFPETSRSWAADWRALFSKLLFQARGNTRVAALVVWAGRNNHFSPAFTITF